MFYYLRSESCDYKTRIEDCSCIAETVAIMTSELSRKPATDPHSYLPRRLDQDYKQMIFPLGSYASLEGSATTPHNRLHSEVAPLQLLAALYQSDSYNARLGCGCITAIFA